MEKFNLNNQNPEGNQEDNRDPETEAIAPEQLLNVQKEYQAPPRTAETPDELAELREAIEKARK